MTSIPQQDFDFSDVAEFSPVNGSFKIRDGNLWALTKTRKLFFCRMLTYDLPKYRLVQGAENILFLFVSPDGKYCMYRTQNCTYFVSDIDLIPHSIHMDAQYPITAVSWLKKESTTTLFMITNADSLYVVSVSSKNPQTQIIPMPQVHKKIQEKPVGLLILDLDKLQKIGMIIITKTQIVPFILNLNYICEHIQNQKAAHFPSLRNANSPLVTEGNMIGVWVSNERIFGFELNDKALKPDDIISNQFFFTIPGNTIWYTINDGLVFTMDMNVHINYLYDSNLYELLSIPVDPSTLADIDPVTKDVYLLRETGFTRYSFPGSNHTSESFFNMLYSQSFNLHNLKLSLHLFTHSGKSLQQHLNHYNTTDRIKILRYLLKDLRNAAGNGRSTIKLQANLAYRCLELCIRAHAESNYSESSPIIKNLLSVNLISVKNVKELCIQYGEVDFALEFMDIKEKLDLLYDRGNYSAVLDKLLLLPDVDLIVDYVIRLLHFDIDKTKEIIRKLPSWDNYKLNHILSAPEFEDIVAEAPITKITTDALKHLYAEYCAKRGNLEFLKHSAIPLPTKMAVIRSLSAQKRYKEFSDGLFFAKQYTDSVLAALDSSIEDCVNSIVRIPERAHLRRNVTKAVFSTVQRDVAQQICRILLSKNCIDQSIALEYLPNDAKVSDLTTSMQSYIAKMCSDQQYITKESKITQDKISRAHVLNKAPKFSVEISRDETCPFCKQTLIGKPFLVFPCGHKYHKECSVQRKECALCANPAIMDIGVPFVGNPLKWSTEINRP
ncbi:hypothetical protein TVAG_303490 [Trichomonas vaginalis G3]|uniref:RING-type domain-containing protein n=1 Tax=Trichomonas vaginalis (strain ATCC PRA-98 / G3) TaxID=412133 RepID=A2DR31_TRIV3|nr:notochord cell vacuolation [Trichomonas vaginalis G3]EAY17130.1 hypothetical protein TVAG_303490 [Trichomonas vaginalis G3]KAI5508845.1 notochord cell vacuolation [Trichomonas vaginalis G3]|eukprot:XP_001329353.1 hypothetical protein [Trichomonas vaginalis G3]